MVDPLGTASGVIAVLQLTGVVVGYLSEIKGASKDRNKIISEIVHVSDLLALIDNPAKQAQHGETWAAMKGVLSKPNGPLEQLEKVLKKIKGKIVSEGCLQRLKHALTWSFEKAEVLDILSSLERFKTLFTLALQNDHMYVSIAVSLFCFKNVSLLIINLQPSYGSDPR
jgi:hypothetical protein